MKKLRLPLILTILVLFLSPVLLSSCDKKDIHTGADADDDYIKWVEFNVPVRALSDALALDISTNATENHILITEALAFASAKHYGEYKGYKTSFLSPLSEPASTWRNDMADNKLYKYYLSAYEAAIGGLVGKYTRVSIDENGNISESEEYGLRAFSPIAEGYYYTDYDDFGTSRSYGYKRKHLGHDMLGSVGTPIIAVESGTVEACGWNQYGGWRIGIRSFDGKRYYYYAHLRKNHPFNDIYEGKVVNAGEVIGYLGMTGYSAKENVNNIDIPHLHFGLELIFDKSQKDGYNQIWIDVYALTKFIYRNRSAVIYNAETKEYSSKVYYVYPETPD